MARRGDTSEPSSRKIGELTMIWRFALAYPGQIAAALLALLIAASATLAIPGGFRLVIDKGFIASGGDVGPYFRYLLIIVLVLALATATRFYFVSWIGERVIADIRVAVQKNLLRLAPAFFEENRPSEIASRLTADTAVIEQVVGTTVSVALRNVFLSIGGIIYLFAIAPKLAAMLLLGIPLVILPVILMGRRLRKLSQSTQDRIADVGATVSETLRAMKIVQGFGQEAREAARFETVVEMGFSTARRRIRTRAVMTAIVIGLIFGSITMVRWQGAVDVASGRLSGGSIAAFILTGGLVAGAFGALAEVYGDIVRAAGAAARLSELLNAEPAIRAPVNPMPLPLPPRGRLEFDHVGFRYPTRPEVSARNAPATSPPVSTNAAIDPPLIRPAATSTAPSHSTRVIDPKISPMTIAVMNARRMMRRLAAVKVALTAALKRAASRSSWPNAWTTFIAPRVSDAIEPTSATRSWLVREKFRTRRPSKAIGRMMTGMPSISMPASFGDSAKR